ncbi:MAG: hypothetical protein F4Z75_03565 [Synechococcus sp. SB0668_bin_15]|nr:hypothetical protein [Synechococcus sp. SB0668_bin_15]MYC48962.1 hypothetical protein [Synechococcus sp. SB0662_bin_14]
MVPTGQGGDASPRLPLKRVLICWRPASGLACQQGLQQPAHLVVHALEVVNFSRRSHVPRLRKLLSLPMAFALAQSR